MKKEITLKVDINIDGIYCNNNCQGLAEENIGYKFCDMFVQPLESIHNKIERCKRCLEFGNE